MTETRGSEEWPDPFVVVGPPDPFAPIPPLTRNELREMEGLPPIAQAKPARAAAWSHMRRFCAVIGGIVAALAVYVAIGWVKGIDTALLALLFTIYGFVILFMFGTIVWFLWEVTGREPD